MGSSVSSQNRNSDTAVNSFIKELNEFNNIPKQRQLSFRRSTQKIDSNLIKEKLDQLLVLEENYNNMCHRRSSFMRTKCLTFEKINSEYSEFIETTQNFFGSLSPEICGDMNHFVTCLQKLLRSRIIIVECLQTLSTIQMIDIHKLNKICSKLQDSIFTENYNKMPFLTIFHNSITGDMTVLKDLIHAVVYIGSFKPLDAILSIDSASALLESNEKVIFDGNWSFFSRRLYSINNLEYSQSQLKGFFLEFRDLTLLKFGLYFDELAKQLQNEVKSANSFILRILNLVKKLKIQSISFLADTKMIDGFDKSAFYLPQATKSRFHVLFSYRNEKSICGDLKLDILDEIENIEPGSYKITDDLIDDNIVCVMYEAEENIYCLCQLKKLKPHQNKSKYEVIHKCVLDIIKFVNLTNFFTAIVD